MALNTDDMQYDLREKFYRMLEEKLGGIISHDEFFEHFPPCVTEILRIPNEILLSYITTIVRLKCRNCGGWKRKRGCPPYIDYRKEEEKMRKCKEIYMLVFKTNGLQPWREGLEKHQLIERKGRALKGPCVGLQVSLDKFCEYLKVTLKKRVYVLESGPCHRCRECSVTSCPKGRPLIRSLEGVGVDVYKFLEDREIAYENPPENYVTCVIGVGIQ